MTKCGVCESTLSDDMFEPHRSTCKGCRNAARKARRAAKQPAKPIAADGMRICTSCGGEKLKSEFGKHAMGKDGLRAVCNSCKKVASATYYSANTEKCQAATARWSSANAERVKAVRRTYERTHPEVRSRARAKARLSGKRRDYDRQYVALNLAVVRATQKKRYMTMRDKILAYGRAWYAANKARHNATSSAWAKANRDNTRAKAAKRKAAKILATPAWALGEDLTRVYSAARRLSESHGVTYEVDHVVPLVSPSVCGLHCHANLQVLAKAENRSKGNRSWPDMP